MYIFPLCGVLAIMDELDKRIQQKNESHRKLMQAENREVFPIFIHSIFLLTLLYYELLVNIGDGFTAENVTTLLFIYIFYNMIVFDFCTNIIKNYYAKCLLLVTLHSVFIYFWIWHQDQYGVAYIVGKLGILVTIRFFYMFAFNKTTSDK